MTTATDTIALGDFVRRRAKSGSLVVQPRMGFASATTMRRGLAAVRDVTAPTIGTITLDSYTRVGDYEGAAAALVSGADMNGYPLLTHSVDTTRQVIGGLLAPDFPIQVRHGSALPSAIVRAALRSGLTATEGGPVSYCLPYSRVPLAEAISDWKRACEALAQEPNAHLESFGGCMLGQLCPPEMLIAITILECMFFRQHGLRDVSLSYAQQTNEQQDIEAVTALRVLASEFLSDLQWHVVIYTYMGVFPQTRRGALEILRDSARLAIRTGSERLIVKTTAEAHRIPTVADNITALEHAHRASLDDSGARVHAPDPGQARRTEVYAGARALIDAVLNMSDDLGKALAVSFSRGYLDVPYCLHPDNRNRTRTFIDQDGTLRWAALGAMPLPSSPVPGQFTAIPKTTSTDLLNMLGWTRARFDHPMDPAAGGRPFRHLPSGIAEG